MIDGTDVSAIAVFAAAASVRETTIVASTPSLKSIAAARSAAKTFGLSASSAADATRTCVAPRIRRHSGQRWPWPPHPEAATTTAASANTLTPPTIMPPMKVGIVVPYSWSFWGGVVEHAELQAEALRALGCEVKTIMGNDPPGQFTRVLHPRHGRHGSPPPDVIPIGRSVIVPANGTLPNIILSPRSFFRIRDALERERFDVVHLHEPMTPTPCIATLAVCTAPMVGTFHASGDLGWMKIGKPVWGFLAERLDRRIAVSPIAAESANRWLPGDYEIVPNGVLIPPHADPANREDRIVFAGRHERRKGLHVLLAAWPRIRRETGVRLSVCGADPLRVKLLISRLRIDDDGIDVRGFLPQEEFTSELLRAKALVAPSLGGESFGIVLVRPLACATPVVASDIAGYRDVVTPDTCVPFTPGESEALADAVIGLLADEDRRERMGAAGRALAQSRYAWAAVGRQLLGIYEQVAA
jgi:phosphatidyl-myo-inositol alpha-mannosyltransferase